MTAVAKQQYYSIAEYLALEESSAERYEYEDGIIRAMSDGTINHSTLGTNMVTLLNNGANLKSKNCRPFNSDLRVRVERGNSFVYPDAMLICGDIETSEQDPNAVTNPILVVEVLSKSTERYDRSDKFRKYCSLSSFKEYILIDQYRPIVDILYREDAAYWKMTSAIGLDKSFYLHTLDLEVQMVDLYKGTQKLEVPNFKMELD
ncbi:MAG: Uma2 family endonuclease [Bacteroidota bacterium]